MTDEEKEKLFRAIGYHESVSPALYPKSYIAIRLEFILRVLRIVITDDYSNSIDNPRQEENDSKFKSTVLCIEFREAFVAIHQRPAAQSFAYVYIYFIRCIKTMFFQYSILNLLECITEITAI